MPNKTASTCDTELQVLDPAIRAIQDSGGSPVGGLGRVENLFLQLLVSRFELTRNAWEGAHLDIRFDDDTQTIWRGSAKKAVRAEIEKLLRSNQDGVTIKGQQASFDSFLLDQNGRTLSHSNEHFPLRFASGGTLPIVTLDGHDYFCLFYRDQFPPGWNIANGSTSSREELLDPRKTIDREFREELLVIDGRHTYTFESDSNRLVEHPDIALIRLLWKEELRSRGHSAIRDLLIPVSWLNGPDSLSIGFGNEETIDIDRIFLNVNAEDFGIEVDRIARFYLSSEMIICDGEPTPGLPLERLDRIVGLFDVEKFKEKLDGKASTFIPDQLFHSGRKFEQCDLNLLMDRIRLYLERLTTLRVRRPSVVTRRAKSTRLGLCPVTRRIIRRYFNISESSTMSNLTSNEFDVFVAYNSRDRDDVSQIVDHLKQKGVKPWYDQDQIVPGRWIHESITEGIGDVKCAAVFFGRSGTGTWQEFELRQLVVSCIERDVILIPVVLPGATLPEQPRMLRHVSVVQFQNEVNEVDQLQRLVKGIISSQSWRVGRSVNPDSSPAK